MWCVALLTSLFLVDKRMKRHSVLAVLVCMITSVFMSCSTGDDYTLTTVSPSTCVVTSVTMGKIPCLVQTKTVDGRDSTYIATITGSNYPMSIDHYGGRIFNVDSLPYGCDVAKVTFETLSSSGSLAINSLGQEVDTFFVATDSTDFRHPRKVTVYALDGVAVRSYWLEVRVHQEEGDAFKWQQQANGLEEWAEVTPQSAFAHEGVLYAYGVENNQPVALTTLASTPTAWNKVAIEREITAPTPYNGSFYALSDGALVQSVDGLAWSEVSTNLSAPLLTLVAGSTALYGVTAAGFVTSIDGVAWTAQEADEPEFLPAENCSAACLPSPTDNTFEDVIVVGTRDGKPVVWKLNVDKSGMYTYTWNYYPENPNNGNPCPELPQRNVLAYDGATLLLGAESDGASVLRLSRDNGRTWRTREIPQLDGVSGAFAATVDANHYVWVMAEGGKVLKGRFNRLGWAQQDRVFTE